MTHPVKKYIENDLCMSTNSFASKNKIPPTSIRNWYSRNTYIDSLSIGFLNTLATNSKSDIDTVYKALLKYEKET